MAVPFEGVYAEYNDNMSGLVTNIVTYTDSDRIYFKLDNQPSHHPIYNPDYFSIDDSISNDRRQQLLSRLLTAYASGKPVNIGFDRDGDCSHGRIRVHRVG